MRVCPALKLDHQTDALTIGFIAQVGQPFQFAIAHQRSDTLGQGRFIRLERKLADDDARFAAPHVLDMDFGADDNLAASSGVGVDESVFFALQAVLVAENQAASGEVWPFDELHQVVDIHLIQLVPTVKHVHQRVTDLSDVMRGDTGRHADSDTG